MKNIQIALIIALLLCLFPMPYGFYIFVRFTKLSPKMKTRAKQVQIKPLIYS